MILLIYDTSYHVAFVSGGIDYEDCPSSSGRGETTDAYRRMVDEETVYVNVPLQTV